MSSLLSQGKSYTQQGDAPYFADTGGIMLTDGSTAFDAWKVGWYPSSALPKIRIDLGALYDLDYVRFFDYVWTPAGVYAPGQLVIKGSEDEVSWDTLGTFVKSTDWSEANNYPTGAWSNNLNVSGIYRYVQFEFTVQTESLSINELEVYGDPASNIKTINGLVKASVKTINGLAIASVKNINGLS